MAGQGTTAAGPGPPSPRQGRPGRRRCLACDRCRLAVSRRWTEPCVGRVGRRRRGGWAAAATSARSFSRQSATLRPASRNRWLVTSSSPPAVTRLPNC